MSMAFENEFMILSLNARVDSPERMLRVCCKSSKSFIINHVAPEKQVLNLKFVDFPALIA